MLQIYFRPKTSRLIDDANPLKFVSTSLNVVAKLLKHVAIHSFSSMQSL